MNTNAKTDNIINNVKILRKDIKNIYLVVNPDCSVVLKVPESTSEDFINSFLKKKEHWIKRQLEYFQNMVKPVQKDYVSGESFAYLGRQYRLKVHKSDREEVILKSPYIHLYVRDKENLERKKKVLECWYRLKAKEKFSELLNKHYAKITNNKPKLEVRKMKKRWGSCNYDKNKIILNLKLIEKPKYCIEYVILHELAHLKYPYHNKDFYNYLTVLMPDWEWRRDKLNEC
ncbi:M48 family metallopeptidase [Methanothermococcus sp.]|uniref:M48 family metallopeptidase n=1 Tax=Methanothermococcus sp. TaxID=2614238 RepID=UPI0025D297E8|nr:SprT family zinc-dependent metalloprotease [Methanothermococcus sp.]